MRPYESPGSGFRGDLPRNRRPVHLTKASTPQQFTGSLTRSPWQTVPQRLEDLMKKAILITAILSHSGLAGHARVGAILGLAIGVFAGTTLHRLLPRLHPLPRA